MGSMGGRDGAQQKSMIYGSDTMCSQGPFRPDVVFLGEALSEALPTWSLYYTVEAVLLDTKSASRLVCYTPGRWTVF